MLNLATLNRGMRPKGKDFESPHRIIPAIASAFGR